MKDEATKLQIKKTILETKSRREHLSCKVIKTKIQLSSLPKSSLTHLHKLFTEAKWLYNDLLSSENINDYNTKSKIVKVKVGEIFESCNLDTISSQMKQSVKTRLFTNMQSLNSLKKKGFQIGKLKFKSRINSIPLKQHNVTFTILKNQGKIRIQGIRKPIKVNGLKQLPPNAEIACANLIKSGKDFFINISCYVPKIEKNVPDNFIGIDFGCNSQITLSNGIKLEYNISPSKRIRKLDKKICRSKSKQKSMTKNRQKLLVQRETAYAKDNNKKKDVSNKIVNVITKNYKYVAFQDDNFRGWQKGNHGKKINGTMLGSIKTALKNKAVVPMIVGKWYPSTQLCSGKDCQHKQKISLKDRIYVCSECGLNIDRDVNSAENILNEGMRLNKIPTERREYKPMEILSFTLTQNALAGTCVKVNQCH